MKGKYLDISSKSHIDCYELLTDQDLKGYLIFKRCSKCKENTMDTTGRIVNCRKTGRKIELYCTKCGNRMWV